MEVCICKENNNRDPFASGIKFCPVHESPLLDSVAQEDKLLADSIGVGQFLGVETNIHSSGTGFYINFPHLGHIFVKADWAKEKYRVRGSWPKRNDRTYAGPKEWGVISYDQSEPAISFDINKSPKLIASEIKRRFLPFYRDLYLKCEELKARYDATNREKGILFDELLAIGGTASHHREDYIDLHASNIYGDMRVDSQTVHFNLYNVSVEKAKAIMGILFDK